MVECKRSAAEEPDDYETGEPFNERLDTERGQRDRPGQDARDEPERSLRSHPEEAEPGELARPLRRSEPLRRANRLHLDERQPADRAHTETSE